MTDQSTEASHTPATQPDGGAINRTGETGTTSIADTVVEKIAAIAAREVDGVASLGGAVSGALSTVVGRIRGSEHATAGVGVEVGSRQAAVDLTIKARYPVPIPALADNVRQNVIDRLQSMTGLEVVEVNIAIVDLEFPGQGDDRPTGRVQ
ncbi:MAG: Asp23/Gls24 family envelope stress response protein [Acidimicrobiales bacterium]